jgi:hypothetical protein
MNIVTTGGATAPHWGASVTYSLKVYIVRTKLNDVFFRHKSHCLLL